MKHFHLKGHDYKLIIENIHELIELEEDLEIGPTAGDACNLIVKFDTNLKIAEAESEGKSKVDNALRAKLRAEAKEKACQTFWGVIQPSLFAPVVIGCEARQFQVAYNPFVAYGGDYVPLAAMLYYSERDLETGEENAMIPVAYVDPRAVADEGLRVEDVQYIVEELFKETMTNFPEDHPDNPTITIPADQVEYYKSLIEAYGWEANGVTGFGYRIFN